MDCRPYVRSKDYINKKEGEFSVVQCRACGLIYTNPRPDKHEIRSYYPETTHYYVLSNAAFVPIKTVKGIYRILLQYFRGYFPEKNRSRLIQCLLYPVYLSRKIKFDIEGIPHYQQRGRLLEIGCSYGKFLHEMKQLGWEVQGTDMSEEAVSTGRKVFGLPLINADIDEFDPAQASFDVIIMRMFLEHAPSPRRILEKAARWLRPQGQLIISVPDVSGIESRLFRNYFYGLHLPNHLYHFTPETLGAYLKSSGFRTVKTVHHTTDADFYGSLKNASEGGSSMRLLSFMQSGVIKIFIRLMLKFIARFWRTGRMTVFAVRD
ncbi:MAG: class I SAM-dependent methyltransferase [Nitrospirae bacterium]|nr:class I SAM-dependent methyltransferase [Nitrospirota bacterium]